jgi:hypothetical protein
MGKAPPGGGQGAGADGLLIRKSRLSQMYVDIHKTGKHRRAVEIDDRDAGGGLQGTGNGNNAAFRNRDVGRTERAAGEDHGVFEDIVHALRSFLAGPGPAGETFFLQVFSGIIQEGKGAVKDFFAVFAVWRSISFSAKALISPFAPFFIKKQREEAGN